MRKSLILPIFAAGLFLLLSAGGAAAQNADKFQYDPGNPAPGFLAKDQVPVPTKYLPGPPDFGTAAFEADKERNEWGKSFRGTEREKQAIADAVHSTDDILDGFAEAFGMHITRESTPKIFGICDRANTDAYAGVSALKDEYMRPRPFVYLHSHTSIPQSEEAYAPTGSYPSGHSVRGWVIALVLAEINPGNQEQILLRGLDYGESRVIVGYHWQSDVDVSRIAGAAVVARLHADKAFCKAMKKAKREYRRLAVKG